MRKIIIIGTLHGGVTPEKELGEILEKYNPNQVLVEIAQEDIEDKKVDSYPPEMIHIYNWARKRGTPVKGFDSKINVFREGITEKDNQRVIEEQKRLLKNFTWKEMNKEENLKILDTESAIKLSDLKKNEEREFEMLNNIKKFMLKEGTIIILTGSGHLKFFEEHIKEAIFPFR